MRLQHAHSDIDDLVLNPLDRHQPFILAITAVGFEECPDLANVLATSGNRRHRCIHGLTVAAGSAQLHQVRRNYRVVINSSD